MKRATLVLLIGIVMIILASAVLGASYLTGSQKTKSLNIPAGGTERYGFALSEDGGILVLSSRSPFSYRLIDSTGKILFSGENERNVELHLNSGNYTVELKNSGRESISMSLTLLSGQENERMLLLTYISGSICTVGMVVFVAGLALVLWNRKREEKIYTRD